MPHVSIKMYPGRSEEVKKALAERVKEAMMDELQMEGKYFSVSVEDIEKENWKEEVVDKIAPENLYVEADF